MSKLKKINHTFYSTLLHVAILFPGVLFVAFFAYETTPKTSLWFMLVSLFFIGYMFGSYVYGLHGLWARDERVLRLAVFLYSPLYIVPIYLFFCVMISRIGA